MPTVENTACPLLSSCGLREALRTVSALRVWQTFYCESAFERCERLRLIRAGSLVPPNLLPNGTRLGGPARGHGRA